MPKRCMFGCTPQQTHSKTIHKMPGRAKKPELFETWVHLAGGKVETSKDIEYWTKKVVCDRHFKLEDHNRYNRLSCDAVPSLHIPARKPPQEDDIENEPTEEEIVQDWTKEVIKKYRPKPVKRKSVESIDQDKETDQEFITAQDIDRHTSWARMEQTLEDALAAPDRAETPRGSQRRGLERRRRRRNRNPPVMVLESDSSDTPEKIEDDTLMPQPFEDLEEEFLDEQWLEMVEGSDGEAAQVAEATPGPHTATSEDRAVGPEASVPTEDNPSDTTWRKTINKLKDKASDCRKRALLLYMEAEAYEKRAAKITAQHLLISSLCDNESKKNYNSKKRKRTNKIFV